MVFFCVSGFLNYFSYYNSSSIKEYYFKRIKRLYPLLLISYLVISLFEKEIGINDIYTLFSFLLNIKNAPPRNGVLWTLIIELQLYLLTPLLYNIMKYFKNVYISFLEIIFYLILIILSIGINSYYCGGLQLEDRTFFSAIPLYFFGITVAKNRDIYFSHKKLFSFYSGFLLLIFCNVMTNFKQAWLHTFIEGRLVPFLILIAILQYASCKIPKIFTLILSYLGKMTFEIYLFHGLGIYFYRYFHFTGLKYMVLFYWILPMIAAFLYVHFYRKICAVINLLWSKNIDLLWNKRNILYFNNFKNSWGAKMLVENWISSNIWVWYLKRAMFIVNLNLSKMKK